MDPKVEIRVRGETIAVREMPWPKAIEFTRKLGLHARKLVDDQGAFVFDVGRLVELIGGTAELAEFLVVESTGKPAEWISALRTSEMLEVIDTALSINLSP